ncbi:peptidyl-tRNA hydrolase [Brevundimonas phage vB_BpoS-Kikimora]|uniref:peptidyl-tRNA hydrolase n=1 Tax=Brevundimonas phage vB_BpoS-Kikimora TaxID=2948601 RepID=A0A9E7SKZ0_9CAUD|nr:peptidyl-tRNA hydrolase [Brevundimonas phage vB_BpoS-Kikimora]
MTDTPERDPDPLRLYCIMSMEAVKKMNGSRGKLGTQAGHAYLHAFWNAAKDFPEEAAAYYDSPAAYKITLRVETDEELLAIYAAHEDVCGRTKVEDAGYTVFDGKTLTCIGLGPIRRSQLRGGAGELKGL